MQRICAKPLVETDVEFSAEKYPGVVRTLRAKKERAGAAAPDLVYFLFMHTTAPRTTITATATPTYRMFC